MKVALLGDMAFYGKYSVGGDSNIFRYFEALAEYLRAFDYVVGNLESPFVARGRPCWGKSAHVRAHPDNVALLAYLNVNVVNLANNHIMDFGVPGYRSTLAALEKEGIQYFGVQDLELRLGAASAGIVLHGYCSYNTNPAGVSRNGGAGVNTLNVLRVEERLRAHHAAGYLNVVSVHSGQEHVNFPSRDDMRMARAWAGVCPFVYYGHHPHVLQGIEDCGASLIAYSLGNVCFDDVYTARSLRPLVVQTENNHSGAVLELEVDGQAVREHRVVPLFAGDERMIVGGGPQAHRLNEYSAALAQPEPAYSEYRNRLISEFIDGRKAVRDLRWYAERLRPSSAGILVRASYNDRQYRRHVQELLPLLEQRGAPDA